MRWRELEYAVNDYSQSLGRRTTGLEDLSDSLSADLGGNGWNKAEWEASLSEDLARRMAELRSQITDENE